MSQLQYIQIMPSKKQIIKLKVCVIGNTQAGKTSFIHRLIGDESIPIQTNEYQIFMFCAEAKNYFLEVQLWDCSANHFTFHKHLRFGFFRNVSAALLIFDVNSQNWRDTAHSWISEAYQNQCYLVYAIATKLDLIDQSKQMLRDSLKEKLNFSAGSQQGIQYQISEFFSKYDIVVIFQSLKQPLKDQVRELFVRMHDEYSVVSRGSLARGLPISLPEDFMNQDVKPAINLAEGVEESQN